MSTGGKPPAGGGTDPPKLYLASSREDEPDEEDFERMAEEAAIEEAEEQARSVGGKRQQVTTGKKEPVSLDERRWRNALLTIGKKGMIKRLATNAMIALRQSPTWKGVFRYNAFSHTIEIQRALPWQKTNLEFEKRQWSDHDDLLLMEWMHREGIDLTTKQCSDAVFTVAKENEFHPVRDYLESLKWDGENRLTTWLNVYLNAADTDYEKMIGPRIWISLVARIMKPGEKADCMPIYIGDQGQRKSTALRVMVGDDWFTDQIGGIGGGKDTSIAMSGKWLVEFSDLDGFHGKNADELKAFVSRQSDRYRAMFGRYAADYPRQTCFAGTTNQRTPLRDFTGNRRYWPIHTGNAEVETLQKDRDQLWAEAVARYRQGDPWWLDTPEARALAAEVAEESREVDVLEEEIEMYLRRLNPAETTVGRVIETVMEIEIAEASRADQMRVAACLQALRWERIHKRVTDSLGTRRMWVYRPISLAVTKR